jgi:tetraacyldisaccharide 4'-kinase
MNFKKPKFWDLSKPNFISYILFPLTLIIRINNFFLDNLSLSKNKNIKTICIGNIYLGGTGKTPTTIKLYNIIKRLGFNVVTAKKFYKNEEDEQIILKEKTNLISEKTRNKIINSAIKKNFDLIVFDDGLQDKKVNYDIKFVCFNSDEWIGNGQLIPSGPLREKLNSLKKYDGVFIKGNDLIISKTISKIIKKINPEIKIYFTNYNVMNLDNFDLTKKYLLFSGIGSPKNFKNLLIKENFQIDFEMVFPDHYKYKISDIINILNNAKNLNTRIITTKKDYVKIPEEFKHKIDYLDVDLNINKEEDLINFLKQKLNEKY